MASPDPQLMTVFSDALERSDPVARAAFLDGACRRDAGLRRLVEELLAAHDGAGRFLEPTPPDAPEAPPAATLAHSGAAAAASPSGSGSITAACDPGGPGAPPACVRLAEGAEGTIIAGRYKLLQQIGEGGMGTVWMADQTEPVRRRVAVKLIRVQQGGSRTILSRFEAERQAIALMDHPHIAKLLDAGSTPDGSPFFVMELVKGLPLNEYCDEHRFGIRERLQLFTQVCSAVQHAHQKGIIHRDLKPSNILVESHDGKPMPKVIDFGVAKATSGLQLSEGTLFTAFGSVMGTPMYMAPEQATFNAVDVDTRADVYALGVILYELLTGTTPITRESMKKAALDEMLRLIREQEAPTPSSRLSSVDTIPSVAANRQMELRKLGRFVKGELDWIVMKALSKERERRYETATGFARDVERFLNNEAVAAGPPSATYRLRKFARRNRGQVVAASLILASLVGGLAASLWQMNRAIAAEALARTNERKALESEALARKQSARAEDRETQAINAVKRFGDAIINEPALKTNPALEDLRKRLMKEPLAFFRALRDQLQADGDTRPESLARLAEAIYSLGYLTDEIGDKRDALIAFRESQAIRQKLAAGNPADTGLQRSLATCYHSIGNMLFSTGKPAEALKSYRSALAIQRKLADANPAVTGFQSDLAASLGNIGIVLNDTPAEALKSYRSALAIQRKLADANPAVTEFQNHLAASYKDIGVLLDATGEPAEALKSYRSGLAIQQRLADANPAVTEFQNHLAASHYNIGNLLRATGEPAEALKSYRSGLAIQRKLADANPAVTGFQTNLAGIYNNIGAHQAITGETAEAFKSLQSALAIGRKLVLDHPESPNFASDLGGTLNNIAAIDLGSKRFEEARVRLREAVEWQRKALAVNPTNPDYRRLLAGYLTNLIIASQGLGDPVGVAEAERELAKLRDSEPAMVALDARLSAILKGDQQPRDGAERLQLAQRAYDKTMHATAAQFWGEALAANPKLAADRQVQHRYNAACAAALAGGGRGKDDPPPDEAARAKLRNQALVWLKAELSAWKRIAMTVEPGNKEAVSGALTHWKGDADLAAIRDDAALDQLPEAERVAFKRLWADIDGLLTSVGGGK